MTDALLFLHLLSAAMLFVTVVVLSAVVLGARLQPSAVKASNALWNIGAVGTLVLGIALAIDIDGYEIWDAWIVIAMVLWLAAGGTGDRVRASLEDAAGSGVAVARGVATSHWIRVALVVLLLADMIWKPWA